MKTLVLVRHGQSEWNREGRFTGWMDVPLTEQGRQEARAAGILLRENGFDFRFAYTSKLTRAIETLHLVEDAMGLSWIADFKDWRLNEKHYGILQGWSKKETAREFGEEQVARWRRAFRCAPPPLEEGDERCASRDPRYEGVEPSRLPRTESLADTVERVAACWQEQLRPLLQHQDSLLTVAHGNSLRALMMLLRGLSEEEVEALNIPTGIPLAVELDERLAYRREHYLGDPARLAEGLHAAEQL